MPDPTNRTIAETETNPLAPLVAALIKALEMNPRAIAFGAAGAPRVQGRALDNVSLGSLTITGTSGVGFTGLDRHALIKCNFVGTFLSTARTLRARYSNDNGSSYGSWQSIYIADGGGVSPAAWGNFRVNLETGEYYLQTSTTAAAITYATASGTHTVPADVNAFQLSWSNTGITWEGDFYCLGGST